MVNFKFFNYNFRSEFVSKLHFKGIEYDIFFKAFDLKKIYLYTYDVCVCVYVYILILWFISIHVNESVKQKITNKTIFELLKKSNMSFRTNLTIFVSIINDMFSGKISTIIKFLSFCAIFCEKLNIRNNNSFSEIVQK